MHGVVAKPQLDPRANGVPIGTRLSELDCDPIAHRSRLRRYAQPDVAQQHDVLSAVHLDQVEHPVEVEIRKRGTPGTGEAEKAGGFCTFGEGSVLVAQEQVIRVIRRRLDHGLDVAFGNEEVDEPVVVDVLELGVPGG